MRRMSSCYEAEKPHASSISHNFKFSWDPTSLGILHRDREDTHLCRSSPCLCNRLCRWGHGSYPWARNLRSTWNLCRCLLRVRAVSERLEQKAGENFAKICKAFFRERVTNICRVPFTIPDTSSAGDREARVATKKTFMLRDSESWWAIRLGGNTRG